MSHIFKYGVVFMAVICTAIIGTNTFLEYSTKEAPAPLLHITTVADAGVVLDDTEVNPPLENVEIKELETIEVSSEQRPGEASETINQYIEIIDSCGPHYGGACVNVRSGPGVTYPSVLKLRNGIVLKVAETVEKNGERWYKIAFDASIRYEERITSDWYVSAEFGRLFSDVGDIVSYAKTDPDNKKRIVINRSEQMLRAYDGDELFMLLNISTGLDDTPTPRGSFTIFKKTPSRYMQGPLPGVSEQYYDLPGVPWDLYFTHDGGAIHGAYWHDNFGAQWSHGCVNLPLAQAEILYNWADIGTPVVVHD